MPKLIKNKVVYRDIFSVDMVFYYKKHIVEFVEDVIFNRNPEYALSEQQKEFLRCVQNNKRVAAKSGKGCGKTTSVAFSILWFMCCFDNPKIVASAPSLSTLNSALWPEIALWLNRSCIKNIFSHTATKLFLNESPKTWFCEPRTATTPENLAGLHAENMLLIMDEASAISQEIFDMFNTTLTGYNNKLVLISNPTRTNGPFFDCFGKFKDKWTLLTLNAEESPIVKEEQIQYFREKYGITSDIYKVSVLGEFPSGSPESFLKLSDVNMAVERYDEVIPLGEIEIGLDVARYGNDTTVLYWRHGYKVYQPKILEQNSIPEAADLVLKTVVEIREQTKYDKRIKVKVDSVGVGAGVCDLLKLDREHNIEVVECNNGAKGNDKYHNEISLSWGIFRDIIDKVGLPNDSLLIEELSSRKWKMSPTGKVMLEPKSEFKKTYGASPDRADALMLCFFNKESEKTIIKNFDPLDKDIVKDHLSYIGEQQFASIFYSKNAIASIIYGSWDGNRLYIYDDYNSSESLIYTISNILSHGSLYRVIGNDKMFSLKGDDLASKFRSHHINIYENFMFNELSSIELLNMMISQKRIVFRSSCKKTIDQIQQWRASTNRVEMEDNFGLCYAILYMISELKNKMPSKSIIATPEPRLSMYDFVEDKNNLHWMLF